MLSRHVLQWMHFVEEIDAGTSQAMPFLSRQNLVSKIEIVEIVLLRVLLSKNIKIESFCIAGWSLNNSVLCFVSQRDYYNYIFGAASPAAHALKYYKLI